jgi:hypothetical protein
MSNRDAVQQSRHSAVHAAGQAVIGRALGMIYDRAATTAEDARSSIPSILDDPWIIWHVWESRGKYRDLSSAVHGQIIVHLAGFEAEVGLLGSGIPSSEDSQRIQSLLEFTDMKEHRLRAQTRRLVRFHRRSIELVAEALLTQASLSGVEINQICHGAVPFTFDVAA